MLDKTAQGYTVLVDVWQALYKKRLIYLQDEIDWQYTNALVAVMLYLDMENQQPLRFIINNEGGDVSRGWGQGGVRLCVI